MTQPSNNLQVLGITLSLRGLVNQLENAIIIISGPAIAISGIIAGIDLLTGGSMFKDVGWLSLTWAICLLLTLDFQVLVLGARAKQTYNHATKSGKRKFVEILMIIVIAAAISSVSVQMQSIIARTQATTTYTDNAGHHTRNLTIDEATHDMGINPVALIWERSALVLVLIFMSGWFRDENAHDEDRAPAQPAPSSISEQDMQRILAALSEVATLKDEVRELRTVQVQEIVHPVIPEHAASVQGLQEAGDMLQSIQTGNDEKPSQGVQSYGDIIAELFRTNPTINDQEAAELAGCSRTTAAKWLKRVRPNN
jgi:hypothetical protein